MGTWVTLVSFLGNMSTHVLVKKGPRGPQSCPTTRNGLRGVIELALRKSWPKPPGVVRFSQLTMANCDIEDLKRL